jgi:hypothetical protein
MRKLLTFLVVLLLSIPCSGFEVKINFHLVSEAFAAEQIVDLPLASNLTDLKGNLTGGALSRVSAATYVDLTGTLTTAWGDRDQLIDTTGQADLDTWWTKDGVTIDTGDTIASGISGLSLQKVEEDGASGVHRVWKATVSSSSGTFVMSAYVSAGENSNCRLEFYSSNNGNPFSRFNLSTGTVESDSGGSIGSIELVSSSPNVYRISIVATMAVSENWHTYLSLLESDWSNSYQGNSGDGIYAGGVMLEELPSGNTIGSDMFDQEALGTSIGNGEDSVSGTIYKIVSQSTLDFTTIGAPDNNAGTYFICTAVDTLGSGDELAPISTPAKGEFTHPAILNDEEITAQNDRDFSSGTIGNWTSSADGAGTVTYDNTAIGGADDKQGLITSSGDTYNIAWLHSSQIGLSTNTLYKFKANLYVPAANTLKDVMLQADGMGNGEQTQVTLSDDTWTEVILYVYLDADIVGQMRIRFDGNPADGDLLYFDDISIRPVQVSWVPYGTNEMEIDESNDQLKISYVDDDQGAYLNLSNAADLSADLTVGETYLVTFDAYYDNDDGADPKVLIRNQADDANLASVTLTTSSASYELIFTATHATGDHLKFDDMSGSEAVYIDDLTIKAIPDYALLQPSDYVNSATVPAKARFETEGLLLEGEATNLLEYSEDFSQWAKFRLNTPSADATGPDGATSAMTLVGANSSSGDHNIRYTFVPELADNTVHIFSIFAKAETKTWVAITPTEKDGGTARTYFDLGNGVIEATPGTDDSGIELIGNGWYRCWIGHDFESGSTAPKIDVHVADDDGDVNIAQNADDLIYVYGAQLEATPYPTSYIPTDGTQVTRTTEAADGTYGVSWTMSNALKDVLTDTGGADTDTDSLGTVVFEWVPSYNAADSSTDSGLISAANGKYNLLIHTGNGLNFQANDGTNTNTNAETIVSGQEHILVVRWHKSNSDLSVSEKNSGTWTHQAASDYDGSFSLGNSLWLHYGNEYPAHYKNIGVWNGYISDTGVEEEVWDAKTVRLLMLPQDPELMEREAPTPIIPLAVPKTIPYE